MTNPNSVQFSVQKINLKTYNGILKEGIHLTKKRYYKTIFPQFKDDIRSTWKTINEILDKKKRKNLFLVSFMMVKH